MSEKLFSVEWHPLIHFRISALLARPLIEGTSLTRSLPLGSPYRTAYSSLFGPFPQTHIPEKLPILWGFLR